MARINGIKALPPDAAEAGWRKLEVDIATAGIDRETLDLPFQEAPPVHAELPNMMRVCNVSCNGRCVTYDGFFACVFNAISHKVRYLVCGLGLKGRHVHTDVVVVFDGVPPMTKWCEQYNRRNPKTATVMTDTSSPVPKRIKTSKHHGDVLSRDLPDFAAKEVTVLQSLTSLTPFSDVLHHVQSYGNLLTQPHVANVVIEGYDNPENAYYQLSSFTVLSPSFVGEGEIKMIDVMLTELDDGAVWDVSIALTDDSDAMLAMATTVDRMPARDVYLYSPCQYAQSRKLKRSYKYGNNLESERPEEAPVVTVHLVDNPAPCRERGYYHLREDFFGRFLGGVKYPSPMCYVVPLLLYGGFEMLPVVISAKMQVSKNVNMISGMLTATRECTEFLDVLRAKLRTLVGDEKAATKRRRGQQNKRWKAARVGEMVKKWSERYVKLLYWVTLYTCYDDRLAWYVPPTDFMSKKGDMWQRRVSILSVEDLVRFLDSGEEIRIESKGISAEPHAYSSSVADAVRVLNGMFLMGAVQYETNYANWENLEAVCAAYKHYRDNCLCVLAEEADPRKACSLFLESSEWARMFTTNALRRCYELTRKRLATVRIDEFQTIMQSLDSKQAEAEFLFA